MNGKLLTGVLLCFTAVARADPGDLAARIERLEDIHNIQNVLGYYEEYQSALEFEHVWRCSPSTRPM